MTNEPTLMEKKEQAKAYSIPQQWQCCECENDEPCIIESNGYPESGCPESVLDYGERPYWRRIGPAKHKIWRCLQCGPESCVRIQKHDPVICHVAATPQDADWRAEFTIDENFASQVVEAMVGREKRGPRATAFANVLGIPPETIKKYTSGQLQPGPWPQLVLTLLAVSDDAWAKLLGLKKQPKK